MWGIVTQVTTAISLAAFVIATIAWFLRQRLTHRERQLVAAPPAARTALVQALNDSFLIPARPLNTTKLAPEQAYQLLLEQLRARSQRYKQTSIVVVALALITASVTIFAMTRPGPRAQVASVVTPPQQQPAPAVPIATPAPAPISTPPSDTRPATRIAAPAEPITDTRPPEPPNAKAAIIVTYNTKSHIYHCPSCSAAIRCTRNCTQTTLAEAEASGGRACKLCGGKCN